MEKAVFKFNGGLGALLCSGCRTIIKTGSEMSQFEKDAMMGTQEMPPKFCAKCQGGYEYTLTRVRDGRTFKSYTLGWIKWNEDGTFKKMYKTPKIGLSCIVDPQYGASYSWLTTTILSIERVSRNELRFQTKNSTYMLNKIKHAKE